ncbi:MAG: biotin transporter BioY [Phycisphaerae bacterium]
MSRPWLAVLAFSLLTVLCSQVRIPVPGSPVPMTLQLLAVLLAGYFLAPGAAALSMVLYLAAGTAGLPVFAGGSAGLFGLTGGYLLGFVLAAGAVSLIGRRSRSLARLAAAGAVGTTLVFVFGALWQVAWFDVSMTDALGGGVLPFLPKAVFELGMALTVVSMLRGVVTRRSADGS